MRKLSYSARLAAARANFEAVKVFVRRIEDNYRNGGEYRTLSLRDALNEMGIAQEAIDDVIALCGNGGFDYCLDHTWANPGTYPDFTEGEYPPPSACVWGIDQLRSRLDCVFLPLPRTEKPVDSYHPSRGNYLDD